MKFLKISGALVLAAVILTPLGLAAYPGFGKKIEASLGESCSKCHVAYPKLRSYGETVRDIGYNVPSGEFEDRGLMHLYRRLPLALRGKVDFFSEDQAATASVGELQLISAGNALDNKLSWWFHKHVMENNELVPLNSGYPHEAWLQFNGSDLVHLRAGMFELPMWFSWSKTKASELDYLYYGTSTNPHKFGLLAAPQFGLQAYGSFSLGSGDVDDWGDEAESSLEGYHYALSLTNGETTFATGFNTFFGRITMKKPEFAVGLFTLAGTREVAAESDPMDGHEVHAEAQRQYYYRFGADGELTMRGDNANLYASVAYGQDFENDFVGGFIGYDHFPRQKLLLSARLDGVWFPGGIHEEAGDDMDMADGDDEDAHAHGTVIADNASSLCVGLIYLLTGNVRAGFEYGYGISGIDSKVSLQLQFAP